MNRLIAYMEQKLPLVNQGLEKILPRATIEPGTLHEAMRYSVLGGGKRIRPLMCLMSAEACGGNMVGLLPAACALELVHTYSLVHDDLPAMDNDDMRRGRLTCHKAFNDAVAVLVGDALLTLAFEVIAESCEPVVAAKACLCLARGAGHAGMVGGQALDIESEGTEPELDKINLIDRWKTGSLMAAACRIGGIIAGADDKKLEALGVYGSAFGIMYQVTDDLMDIEKTSEELGKTAGKDQKQKKLTYPAAIGVEASRELARKKASEASAALKGLGKEAVMLRLLVDYTLERSK
jgi:geranylgeranyl diphosphate synthase type II